jgi:ribonuclease HI
VWVKNGEVIAQRHGHDRDTTNNRMELTALIEGYRLLPADAAVDVYTDSQLCVNTITRWAAGWERNGWRRKGGEVKNLDLVKTLWALAKAHPKVRLRWIAAHNGQLWNEYADALATAWARAEL